MLLVNGLLLVVVEAKTPVRASQSWIDGAAQVHDDYEQAVPELFVPNLCSVATDGKELRYGSIGLPVDLWGPWRTDDDAGADDAPGLERVGPWRTADDAGDADAPGLERVGRIAASMLRPRTVVDLLGSFTAWAAGKGRRAKIVARYQQVEAVNRIVERVVAGRSKKGLIWHFQGSGKSLLMLFAARRLRLHPKLGNPTVVIVVDRIDLDTQISATFQDAVQVQAAPGRRAVRPGLRLRPPVLLSVPASARLYASAHGLPPLRRRGFEPREPHGDARRRHPRAPPARYHANAARGRVRLQPAARMRRAARRCRAPGPIERGG